MKMIYMGKLYFEFIISLIVQTKQHRYFKF